MRWRVGSTKRDLGRILKALRSAGQFHATLARYTLQSNCIPDSSTYMYTYTQVYIYM